jgi:hypothetical protein
VELVYARFIAMCDHKKWLSDEEIGEIAREVTRTAAA